MKIKCRHCRHLAAVSDKPKEYLFNRQIIDSYLVYSSKQTQILIEGLSFLDYEITN